jgi:hypothetical protein
MIRTRLFARGSVRKVSAERYEIEELRSAHKMSATHLACEWEQ